MLNQTGFLLSYIKYGDQDAILNAFTKENGFQSYFLKGLYTPRNRKKAYLSPLNLLQFTSSSKPAKNLPLLTKIEMISSVENSDMNQSAILMFMADFLNHGLRNESQNTQTFVEIQNFIEKTEAKNHSAYLVFLINFLNLHGLTPNGSGEFLNPETGHFSDHQAHQNFDLKVSETWHAILNSASPYSVKIKDKKAFLDSVLIYYHYHFPEFRTPVSLEIIRQLF